MANSLPIEAERVAEIARAQLTPYLESQGSDQQRIVQQQRQNEGERGEMERTDRIEHKRIVASVFGKSERENLRLVGLEQLEQECIARKQERVKEATAADEVERQRFEIQDQVQEARRVERERESPQWESFEEEHQLGVQRGKFYCNYSC